MTKEMTFNGVDMSRFFRITDIIRPIGNKRSVSTDSAPLLGGEYPASETWRERTHYQI